MLKAISPQSRSLHRRAGRQAGRLFGGQRAFVIYCPHETENPHATEEKKVDLCSSDDDSSSGSGSGSEENDDDDDDDGNEGHVD